MHRSKLRKYRKARGYSLAVVASLLGRSREWLRRIESGSLRMTREIEHGILRAIRKLDADLQTAGDLGVIARPILSLPRRSAAANQDTRDGTESNEPSQVT